MRSVKLAVNHDAERNEIQNTGRRDHSVSETRPGQSLRATVILGHGLENDAPPKVTIDLDVPLVPTGIDRVAPAFFFEQLKDCSEQVMAVPRFITPETAASQAAARNRARRQIFVRTNHIARRPFEMEPGEKTRKSADERLNESETHNQQTYRKSIKLRFDIRPNHVRKSHGQRSTEH